MARSKLWTWNKGARCACRAFLGVLLVLGLSVPESRAQGPDAGADLIRFQEAVAGSRDVEALSLGDKLLGELRQKYRSDQNFTLYEARLKAAEFLADRMQQELSRATGQRLSAAAEEILDGRSAGVNAGESGVAPARRFYETSAKLFATPVEAARLTAEEKSFLVLYYNLKLRMLTHAIVQAGQALSIAQPQFAGTHDYALVLPLLHASEGRPLNVEVLPSWMRQADQMHLLSESCLLHFELPYQAMAIARMSSQQQDQEFSEREYYCSAADRHRQSHPRMAVECLHKAIACGDPDADVEVKLRLQVFQIRMDGKDYLLAASEAREVFETYPDHPDAGKAVWLYYCALSSGNNFDAIARGIDAPLQDTRYESFRPRLLYLKWVALKRKGEQAATVAVVEHELLQRYGDNPVVAPVMLARAVDLWAAQSYGEAQGVLTQLMQKFPGTEAADQAGRIIQRLKSVGKTGQ